MKRMLLTLCLLLASVGAAGAQAPASSEPDTRAWGEKLFGPANLLHDFGIVLRGEQLRHGFVMTNVYAVPIEITSVQRSP